MICNNINAEDINKNNTGNNCNANIDNSCNSTRFSNIIYYYFYYNKWNITIGIKIYVVLKIVVKN